MDYDLWRLIKDEVMTLELDALMDEAWGWLDINRGDSTFTDGAIVDQDDNLKQVQRSLDYLKRDQVPVGDSRYRDITERVAGYCIRNRMRYDGRRPDELGD
jgi:hypothetical protein